MRPFSPKDDRGRGDKPPDDRPKDRGHEPPIEDSQGESSKTNKTRNQAKEQDQQVKKLPDHIAHDGPCPKVIRILHKPITTEPNTENQYSKKIKLSKDDLPSKKMLSRWEKLSQKEKDEKKRKWIGKGQTLKYWEIPPFATPPRNEDLDVSLEDDQDQEDQEILDDVEYGEQEEREAMKAKEIPTDDSDESEDDNRYERQRTYSLLPARSSISKARKSNLS